MRWRRFGGGAKTGRGELIGPVLGHELRRNALIAFGVALLAQQLTSPPRSGTYSPSWPPGMTGGRSRRPNRGRCRRSAS